MSVNHDRKCSRAARRGFTLLELVITIAVLIILAAMVLAGLVSSLRVTSQQLYLQQLDQQGTRIIQEATFHLRPAVLPIFVRDAEKSSNKAEAFELLDDTTKGFGGSVGRAWRSALQSGIDSLAFVVPVDAQGDGDILDDANHIELGQIRRDGSISLDSAFTVTGTKFYLDDTGDASSLVRVDPDKFTRSSANDNTVGAVGVAGWPAALYTGGPPVTSAFTVIRYVPQRVTGTNTLVTIRESDLRVDLDGDGAYTSIFNIGRLQLVYVGGTHAVQVGKNNPVMRAGVATQVIDLSGDYVLRYDSSDPSNKDSHPIFRLVRYSSASVEDSGIVDPDSGNGSLALAVRVNLFDPAGYASMRPRLASDQHDRLNRVFEATIMLRNMAR